MTICAGVGKAPIELEGVLPFDGFDVARDPLFVRALVLENSDGTRACYLNVDATSLRDDSVLRSAAARAANVAENDVWVGCTHTFCVPHLRTPEHLASNEERARNVLLAERWAQAAGSAVEQAVASLLPAVFETACGECTVNVNRDVEMPQGWWIGVNPEGFSDHTLRVLSIRTQTNKPVAILYSADVQSSILQGARDGQGRAIVSGDLAGEANWIIEERTGAVSFFCLGAAGDQAPRAKGEAALAELGNELACGVLAALNRTQTHKAAYFELSSCITALPAQRRHDFATLAPTNSYEFVEEGSADTRVSLFRLGDLTVVGIEPEVESAFGARLRRRSALPGKLELLTMVNGAQKYLSGAVSYDRITYEAMNSGFARGAEEQLEATILQLARPS